MPFSIRPATAADQPAITALVRQVRLHPTNLPWARFLVAESAGQVVGVVQVKPHSDGSRELGSLAVRPDCQGQGIGTALCRALLERERGNLYLMCRSELEEYYQRLDFRAISGSALPPYFHRIARLAGAFQPLLLGRVRLLIMKREGNTTHA